MNDAVGTQIIDFEAKNTAEAVFLLYLIRFIYAFCGRYIINNVFLYKI